MWNHKNQIRKGTRDKSGKLDGPSKGAGIFDTLASTGTDMLIEHGIPWLGKKAVEAGRYYASEALRNPKLQKKALDYALEKAAPLIQKAGSEALDQLSTKIRPNKKYKTDRKDLDQSGGAILDTILEQLGTPGKAASKSMDVIGKLIPSTQHVFDEYKSGEIAKRAFSTDTGVLSSQFWTGKAGKKTLEKYKDYPCDSMVKIGSKYHNTPACSSYKNIGWHPPTWDEYEKGIKGRPTTGGSIDIHKVIGKLPKPKGGWTLPGHKFTGPYNDLENQVKWDPKTGEILEIYDKPTGKTDAIAMQHDVDYSVCKDDKKCKNEADRKMVKALDSVPYNERQWGHWMARNMINTKQKLGLGRRPPADLSVPKNVKSRRVKTLGGKKN